jgi:hypothetical protein
MRKGIERVSVTRCAALLFFVTAFCHAEPVTNKVDVLGLARSGKVEFHLSDKEELHDAPGDVFRLSEGLLHVSGRGYGYLATRQPFRDYHLVVEFKWGSKTWGKRSACARDSGVLVHAHGPHGACGGTWIASFEAQIIEGGMGDIIVISAALPDGTAVTSSLSSEIAPDRDREKRWKRGAARQTVTGGRVNWEKRDEDWSDVLGYRGAHDPDAPTGEWNRLEVIADGSTLRYIVNGRTVNEAFEVTPCEGRICLQTEAAEMVVRRFELWPLGKFRETWLPAEKH